jgi:hypothetical protein
MNIMNRIGPALLLSLLFIFTGTVSAAEDVGAVVALRGGALIQREAKVIEAKLKDGIQLIDSVETREQSKAKMLFIDDSVLTMSERSKVVIKEFLYSKGKGGKSIFNLIDGKMRSVVGKSEFEVHTPTLVAAARGTVFDCETGRKSGELFTTCTCFEGEVDIRSIDPTISGRVTLRPGMTVTVLSGQPVPAPVPVPASRTTAFQTTGERSAAEATDVLRLTQAPPVYQQQPTNTQTPVKVGIILPPAPGAPPAGSIRVGW